MKLVSVIIPCYNQAHFLGEAIESVLCQSYRHFEIIVVDDGSPDNTSEVASRYPGVRCILQANLGQGAARNTGFRESKGNYLVFLDADDRLLPNALETGVYFLDIHPECAFVYGHIQLIASNGSPLPNPEQPIVTENHYLNLLRYNYLWTPAVVMYRRTALESIGDFNISTSPSEDWELNLRITRVLPIHCHGKTVAEYRLHSKNITQKSALMLKRTLAVLHSQWKYIKGKKDYEEAYKSGVKIAQDYYGEPLVYEILNHVRAFELKQAVQKIQVLLRYYPLGLTKLIVRKAQKQNLIGKVI